MSRKIRLLLCEDHALIREGLRTILAGQPAFEVVAEARDREAAVEAADRLHPDVVLVDIDMSARGWLETTRRLVALQPPCKVLVLSFYDDEEVAARCRAAGAGGYVLKDGPAAELFRAIRELHLKGCYASPRPGSRLGRWRRSGYNRLTARERDVLSFMVEGVSTREMATRLGLRLKTVDAHRSHLMRKLERGAA